MNGSENEKEKRNGLSRRQFIKGATAAGVLAATPGIFHLVSRKAYAAGKAARVLMIPDLNITPGLMASGNAGNVCSCIYDWLFRLEGPEQKFTPCLAESYERTPDARVWTIKLREGVKFHHGTPFTSDDVLFTVNRWLDPKIGSPMRSVFSALEKTEKVDSHVVRFHLSRPNLDFLLKFLDYNTAILAHDFDYAKSGNTMPSGTGPFKVVNHTPGQRMALAKNPDYFVPGLPKVDNLDFIFIKDKQTQMMTLESGQADVVRFIGFDELLRYKNSRKVDIVTLEMGYIAPISMRCDQPPFNDNRVREAMKLVVDRKAMVDSVCYGYGIPGNDSFIWPKNKWYTPTPLRERDVDKAKKLLADAGFAKGLDVNLYCASNHPPILDTVLTFQEMAKPAGINVQVRGSTRDIYLSKYWRKVPLMCTNWGPREDPLDLMRLCLKSGAPWNEGHYANPTLDKLLDAAGEETDVVRRKELFGKIDKLVSEEGPSIVAYFYNGFGAVRKGVKGFQLTRNWINDYRFLEV